MVKYLPRCIFAALCWASGYCSINVEWHVIPILGLLTLLMGLVWVLSIFEWIEDRFAGKGD